MSVMRHVPRSSRGDSDKQVRRLGVTRLAATALVLVGLLMTLDACAVAVKRDGLNPTPHTSLIQVASGAAVHQWENVVRLRRGRLVDVQEKNGRHHRGRVRGVDAHGITLTTDPLRTQIVVPRGDVARVKRILRESEYGSQTLKYAGLGALAGVAIALVSLAGGDDRDYLISDGAVAFYGVTIGAAVGAAIGVDKGRELSTVVYEVP